MSIKRIKELTLREKDFKDQSVSQLQQYVLKNMELTTDYFRELDMKVMKLEAVSGMSIDEIYDAFKRGCGLVEPGYNNTTLEEFAKGITNELLG